ncbi:hypothetical protein L486_06322 [Kwoniella mangroviensis CBS 10435]|uniref:Uncharacterized protein n=1 Tax=Kwoniella mangroviensis CBS 10435 TaxID=1331196 RepID=A0A1B9IL58_9TREE|nr:hypothetical protein L486_06322 [Kwoniella mangroviensis CBS 10435]
MPPGIISPRAGMTSVKLSPMILHRVYREAVDAEADIHRSNAPSLIDTVIPPLSRHTSQNIRDGALKRKRLSDDVYPSTPSRSVSSKKVQEKNTTKHASALVLSNKQQVLSFEVKEWLYTGKLWDVYRGLLHMTDHATPPLSLVLKIMKPMSFNPSRYFVDDKEDYGALSYHPAEYKDADAAVKAAYNEDTMYHHLLNFQGTVIPNYHGLFVWPSSEEDDTQIPGLMAMLLEDLGEQILPEDTFSKDISEEEWSVNAQALLVVGFC